ncbi:Pyridoxal phosphate-dependent transferase domain 1 [Sesbania bispinosa]|nr:Pyridoxal phosphate-dependent transferase domain 1 [Sesbania bispinosa]
MHQPGENSTSKLQWKSSQNPFIFGSFNSPNRLKEVNAGDSVTLHTEVDSSRIIDSVLDSTPLAKSSSSCNLKTEERRDEIVDLCCNQDAHGDSSAVFTVPCVSAITKSDSDLTNQISRKICKLSFAPEQTMEAFDVAGNSIKLIYIVLSYSLEQDDSQKLISDITGSIGKECVDLWLSIANAIELFDQMPQQTIIDNLMVHELVSGGIENHLVLVNLKNKANKNTIPGDVSAMVPGVQKFAGQFYLVSRLSSSYHSRNYYASGAYINGGVQSSGLSIVSPVSSIIVPSPTEKGVCAFMDEGVISLWRGNTANVFRYFSGIRMGTPALTSRGFVVEDFIKVAEFFGASVNLAVKIKTESKGTRHCWSVSKFDASVQGTITSWSSVVATPIEMPIDVGLEAAGIGFKFYEDPFSFVVFLFWFQVDIG